jgi:chromosome segregation ATPase
VSEQARNIASTTELWETVREAARWCPSHRMSDCSPLLNGCSVVNKRVGALDTLRERAEKIEAELGGTQDAYFHLQRDLATTKEDRDSYLRQWGPLHERMEQLEQTRAEADANGLRLAAKVERMEQDLHESEEVRQANSAHFEKVVRELEAERDELRDTREEAAEQWEYQFEQARAELKRMEAVVETARKLGEAQSQMLLTVLNGSPVEDYQDAYDQRETAIENVERTLAFLDQEEVPTAQVPSSG